MAKGVNNRLTYEAAAAKMSRSSHLEPAERELLFFLREKLSQIEMLDIGVGAGRTAYFFAALVRNYVGLDYANSVIEICRRRFAETERQKFLVADATDLSVFPNHSFDLIMFSFNGIDNVTINQRSEVLNEVRRLLRPDGYFFFSTHSLDFFPHSDLWPKFSYKRPLRYVELTIRRAIVGYRLWRHNHKINLDAAKKRGWVILRDRSYNFRLVQMHTTAKYQVEELERHGFDVVRRFDGNGTEINLKEKPSTFYSHYLCRPAEGL